MNFDKVSRVYFIGIGGIGMSALARYFKAKGCDVCGYDRTETDLTRALKIEGIAVHYTDNTGAIPLSFRDSKDRTLVIYTPAVPTSHSELQWFKTRGYAVVKRSEALGLITRSKNTIAVAGTHGKTSVSTMIAHLLTGTRKGCDAFLGGVSKNYCSNMLLSKKSEYIVAEADEYDRSFLRLTPYAAVVTAMDADHLDIYGTHAELKKAFAKFTMQIKPYGTLLAKYGLKLPVQENVNVFTYSLDNPKADFYAENIRMEDGRYFFDLQAPHGVTNDIRIGVPGLVNVENAVAASAIALLEGVAPLRVKAGMASYMGVRRRFDYRIRTEQITYIDDYAHHPEELSFTIQSVRELYPDRRITGIFQPHLYSRTRDFADGFAKSLGMLDALILLDIYPAREEPIEGVTSQMIFDKVKLDNKRLCHKEEVLDVLSNFQAGILLTLGAGDIDTLAAPIEEMLKRKII